MGLILPAPNQIRPISNCICESTELSLMKMKLESSDFYTQSHLQGFLPFCTHHSPILHPTFPYSRIQSHIEEFRFPIVAPNSHPRTQQRKPTQECCVRHHLWGQRRWRKAPEKTRWVLTCVCVVDCFRWNWFLTCECFDAARSGVLRMTSLRLKSSPTQTKFLCTTPYTLFQNKDDKGTIEF